MNWKEGLRTPRINLARRRPTAAEFASQKEPAKTIYHSLSHLHGHELLAAEPVQKLMAYATDWEPFIVNREPKVAKDTPGIFPNLENGSIALPHPFITPSTKENTQWPEKQFYWDIYFINKGLLATGDPKLLEIAKGHVENFQYMFDRLGFIPNASDISLTNRSQIPFLTGMIRDIYKETGDKNWLSEKMNLAKREYNECMMTESELRARGSSRPSSRISNDSVLLKATGRDIDKLGSHYEAAAFTGQDDSAEWARRANEYVPITLNSAMYKYESDFAWAADVLGNPVEKLEWDRKAQQRKEEINKKLWDEKQGRYANAAYNRHTKSWDKDLAYHGLSSFMPLWVGLANNEQANKITQTLPKFEAPYGLMIATANSSPEPIWVQRRLRIALFGGKKWRRYEPAVTDILAPQQWDSPNVWAPMQYFAVDGLMRYGKYEQSQRVLENSLRGMAAFFAEHGTLPEKLNGKTGQNGKNYQYLSQEGFGWTNAWVKLAYDRLQLLDSRDRVYDRIAS